MTQAQLNANTILFPPGRLVQGDLYEAQDKDLQGNPLTIKTGANAGKPRVNYYFAVAIPKTQAQWWLEPWGATILGIANAAWPQGQTQNPKFAWKIEDGDSQMPNENGRKNIDREGHPGNWILKFGSSFPTKVFDAQGNPMIQPGLVKRGFWVEVLGSIESNSNVQKPGIYLNHNLVSYRAPDKEIMSGPDPRAVGFGRAALPAHVTAAPVGTGMTPTTPSVPATPGGYAPPAAPGMPPAAPGAMPPGVPGAPSTPAAAVPPGAPPAAPVSVQPHPGFIAPPVAGAHPSVPAAAGAPPPSSPPAPPAAAPAVAYPCPLGAPAGYRMVNPQGARYEAYRQNGWADAQLLAQGHMVRL